MKLFFRVKDNGATVYRPDVENRDRRLDLHQVATVNVRNGEIRVQPRESLSEAERLEVEAWIAQRRRQLAERELDDARRLIEAMNEAAHWAQGKCSDEQIVAVADDLLMAMHDLRAAIVRRKSELTVRK